MKEKKMILIALISGGAVLLALAAGLAAYIGSASDSAAEAARAFEALLSEGKLAELEARCYLPEEGQAMVFPEQGGDAQVRSVTPAELAERFGADAVLAGQETSLEEELLSVIMRYSTLRVSTGVVAGNRTSARLTLTGPDLSAWLSSLGPEEAALLMGTEERIPEMLEENISMDVSMDTSTDTSVDISMDIPMRTVSQSIAMQKRNGVWHFAVTREQENEWFCGLLSAAASEPAAADGPEQ